MFTDPDTAWVVYLTAQEVVKALLCAWFVRNVFGYCGAVWFFTQAVDEVMGGNVWGPNDMLEAVTFTILAVCAWIYHRHG